MATVDDTRDCATSVAVSVIRCGEIKDHPLWLIDMYEVDPRSSSYRGAERPPWPKIAASHFVVAWKLPHNELQHFALASNPRVPHNPTGPSPLTTTTYQRKRRRGVTK
jgi:hypothetical protein